VTASLKVLRVIARLNVGGPARHVAILDRGLRGLGFQTMLAYGETGPGEASLEHLAAQLPAARIAGLGPRLRAGGDLRAFLSLVRLVFALRPDVVHTHTAKAGALGRLAAWIYNVCRPRRERCLIVHTFHGHVLQGYFGAVGTPLVRLIERGLGAVSDCVLVLSPQQHYDIAERYAIAPAERVRIVPLGLELSALLALPPAREGTIDRVVFGFVGRFVPIKNLPLLVDAFAAVRQHVPEARLLMVGDGEVRPVVERRLAAAGLREHVELLGWREDLATVYERIDVLVLSSLNEGTPVSLIEGMAAARPVIATAIGGVPDVITDGRTGVLVPSGDVAALTAAMVRLARAPAERRRLGAEARLSVQHRFAAPRLVSEIATLYRTEVTRLRAARPEPLYK